MKLEIIKKIIEEIGVGKLAPICQSQIVYNPAIRKECSQNDCGYYGNYYTCPPYVGSKEDCIKKAKTYPEGYIYWTDNESETDNFSSVVLKIQKKLVDNNIKCLHLGDCGCNLCNKCGKRDNVPCRNKQMACPSIKSFCIDGEATLEKATGETALKIGLILVGGDENELQPEKENMKVECDGFLPKFTLNPVDGEYGVAVDIGTTTIAARAVNLKTGQLYEPALGVNRQRSIGLDVMSRIDAAIKGELEKLYTLVKVQVDELILEATQKAGISLSNVANIVVTGNTTELYLYTNRDPQTLAKAPFIPDCLFGYKQDKTVFPPCFGAFVGGDIYTAILSSGMLEKNETAMLVDLGTNGEIALYNNGKFTCCATACGPAFESSSTLYGNELIDLIAKLLDEDVISPSGRMDTVIEKDGQIVLTPEDVRSVQLAKAAICGGIISLLEINDVKPDEVKTLYLAGGFGKHLDVKSAIRIGLFPEVFKDKVKVLGNGALSGAIRMLLDKDYPGRDLLQLSECINLANTEEFQDNYIEQMSFEENE